MVSQKGFFHKLNIIFIYLVILIASVWVSYSVFKTGTAIKQASQSLTINQLPTISQISELKHWLNDYERILYEFYSTFDREVIYLKLNNADEQIKVNIHALDHKFSHRKEIKEVIKLFSFMKQHAKLLDAALPPEPYDWDVARSELTLISQYGENILPYLNDLHSLIRERIEDSKEDTNQQLERMSMWVFIFSGLILLIAFLVGYFIYKKYAEALEKQRLGLFVENNPNPVICIDFDGKLVFANASWRLLYSYNCPNKFIKTIFENAKQVCPENINFAQIKIQEEEHYIELSIHKIKSLEQFMVYIEDISAQEKSLQELEFLAYNDELTRLPNLRKLELDLNVLTKEDVKDPFLLVSVGVKRLPLVTTTHGYLVSNALMKALTAQLKESLSRISTKQLLSEIYQFSSAEFIIVLSGYNKINDYKKSISKLQRIIQHISKTPLDVVYGQFYLDLQIGCTIFPEHAYSTDMLIKNAITALHESQKSNLNQITFFSQELAHKEQNWFELEYDLKRANFEKDFFLTYQLKVTLSNSKIAGMEALVRWKHPERGVLSPADFIPIAEKNGMILALGEWVLNAAIKQTSEWVHNGTCDLQVAINVSPSQLLSEGFVEKVFESLLRYNLPGKHLELEITEEIMIGDKARCIQLLEELRRASISIAVDDFGTGYSSLGYINHFPLSKLKIDRSFVSNIHYHEENYAIVRTIIALSKALGIDVIAEGIENQEELDVLNQLGCHQGQGFFFSKPLSASDFYKRYINSPVLYHVN